MDNPHKLITAGNDKSPKKESKKGSDADTDTNIEGEELDSPLNMNLIDFSQEIPNDDTQTEEIKTPQDLPSFKDKKIYDQSSFIYDKYSKRIIYFDVPKKKLLIYNRTKTKLLKKFIPSKKKLLFHS